MHWLYITVFQFSAGTILLCSGFNEYFNRVFSVFVFCNIFFFLMKLLSISVAFLLTSSSCSLWLPPLSWRPYFLTSYWGSKIFVQCSLLVTRINPFQKKKKSLFSSGIWGQASFSLCWSFLHGLMFVYFLLFTILKFWQIYPDTYVCQQIL